MMPKLLLEDGAGLWEAVGEEEVVEGGGSGHEAEFEHAAEIGGRGIRVFGNGRGAAMS